MEYKGLFKKSYIERVRRDLYAVISMETEQPIPNRFQIASRISDDSIVSHHSAFEFYGYANQVFYEVYFSTKKKVRPFDYDGLHYQPVLWHGNNSITEINGGVRVTSLERAVIDSIADFTKIGGLEEVLRCIALIPSLDEAKLLVKHWGHIIGDSFIRGLGISLRHTRMPYLYRRCFSQNA